MAHHHRDDEPSIGEIEFEGRTFPITNHEGGLAHYLHFEKVPADFWGVSLTDIMEFRSQVYAAVAVGTLKNTATADWQWELLGPNMYMVNEQLIKPTTGPGSRVPFASWALMKNCKPGGPGGLLCDLFVSHAWAEGAYEFSYNMIKNWPRECMAAYICFLSNPQWLDIGQMVARPETSPFHVALCGASMRRVLWLSNANATVHQRLWCVYEAFLANRNGLSVDVAGCGAFLLKGGKANEPTEEQVSLSREAKKKDDLVETIHIIEKQISAFHINMEGAGFQRLAKAIDFEEVDQDLHSALGDAETFRWLFQRGSFHEVHNLLAIEVNHAKCSSSSDTQAIWAECGGQEQAIDDFIHETVRKGLSVDKWAKAKVTDSEGRA